MSLVGTRKTKSDKERKVKKSKVDNEADSLRKEQDREDKLEVAEGGANQTSVNEPKTFADLGMIDILQEACKALKYTKPTPIQEQAIPYALEGRDVLGFAATGSGKTAAFAIPVLQALYENPSPLFCCVLSPTRELAHQIAEQFTALGSAMGVRCIVITGGENSMQQSLALSKKPHVIVATPGRLLDHLEKTKGFSLRTLKFLVLDEADRLLDMDFKEPISRILSIIPKERRTFLFSATPSKEVESLQRASLSNPIRVSVSNRITTVDTLLEYYVFLPLKNKDATLVHLLNEFSGKSVIVFVNTKDEGVRLPILCDSLGFKAIPINGNMAQSQRLGSLTKFKAGACNILVATNVAARGLDIPSVDVVINYSVPDNKDDYIHRVGRTARAGRTGKAITFVSQYDVSRYSSIEKDVHQDKKLPEYDMNKDEVALIMGTIDEAQRQAKLKVIDIFRQRNERNGNNRNGNNKRALHGKRNRDDMDRGE